MANITKRVRWMCVLTTLSIFTLGCAQEERQANRSTSARCSELAAKNAIDEQCAVELAKAEIRRRERQMIYTRFTAKLLMPERLWAVTAIYEPETPGGHVIVFIRTDGQVHGFESGE